ncbi:MAG TPA: hypothetical protein VNX00_02800 [Herbaspirillum sp.]|nr:hypothetical protein [Herbaspirillum sp.]
MSYEARLEALLHESITPLAAGHILNKCNSIEKEYPYITSGRKWVLDYKRFQIEMSRGNLMNAIRHLKNAIVLAPYSHALLAEYNKLVNRRSSHIRNIALLISCKKYEDKALSLAAQFDAAGIEYLIVSGADTAPIVHAKAIQVETPDNYESLPRKVIAAFTWVRENIGPNVGVLKVDDDQMLMDPGKLRTFTGHLYDQDSYAGLPVSGTSHDRNWHWNKCQDPALNKRSYGRPFFRPWATGGAYYLAPGPLHKLVTSLMRFPGLFESEYYEDKLVGDTLMFEGVELTACANEDFGLSLTEQHRFNEA